MYSSLLKSRGFRSRDGGHGVCETTLIHLDNRSRMALAHRYTMHFSVQTVKNRPSSQPNAVSTSATRQPIVAFRLLASMYRSTPVQVPRPYPVFFSLLGQNIYILSQKGRSVAKLPLDCSPVINRIVEARLSVGCAMWSALKSTVLVVFFFEIRLKTPHWWLGPVVDPRGPGFARNCAADGLGYSWEAWLCY